METAGKSQTFLSKISHIFCRYREIHISPFNTLAVTLKREIRIVIITGLSDSLHDLVIAYVERSVIRFCKCSQITNHILISPSCQNSATIFFLLQDSGPCSLISFWHGRTANIRLINAASYQTPSPGIVSNTSRTAISRKSVRCIHTKIFIKACFKISFSLVILKCSIFVNANPFRMLISHSFIPSDRCVQICLDSSLPSKPVPIHEEDPYVPVPDESFPKFFLEL